MKFVNKGMTEEEIAISFSMGRFEEVFDYISSNAVWEIIESSTFIGRDEIRENLFLLYYK